MFTMMSHASATFSVTWTFLWTSTFEVVCFTYSRWPMWTIHIYDFIMFTVYFKLY